MTIARCESCYAPAVGSPPVIVHARGCRNGATRLCENPDCGQAIAPERAARGARTCDDRCRAAAWKARTGYGRHDRRKARANAKPKPSGLQISYRRAVRVLAHAIATGTFTPGKGVLDPRELAESILYDALSDRQREQLEARR